MEIVTRESVAAEAESEAVTGAMEAADAAALESTASTAAFEPMLDSKTEIEIAVRKSKRWIGVLAAGLVVALGLAAWLWFGGAGKPSQVLTESDVILLTDFENTTGDPVFDGTLKEALAVKLEESPFLKLAPDRQVRETLAFMGRAEDEPVTAEVGQEICEREGIKAVVSGQVAPIGSAYVVTLSALECLSGEVLAREQVQAASKEEVLTALGQAATGMRTKLGESLASVEQFDVEVEQATTQSLEALKAFSLGVGKRSEGLEEESIAHFRRAIELDPDFALAHARLGTVLVNLREWDEGIEQKSTAFGMRDRVSEKENFYITAHYHADVTGQVDKQIEAYEIWKATYPRDFIPSNNLSALYAEIGELEKALVEAERAIELETNEAHPYTEIGLALIQLGRFEDAGKALEEAFSKGFQHYDLYRQQYSLYYLVGDEEGMRGLLEAVAGRSSEAWLLKEAASAAAAGGQLTRSRKLMRQAIEVSLRHGFEEQAASFLAASARWDAAFGNKEEARDLGTEALEMSRNRDSLPDAAIALAVAGATDEALQMVGELGALYQTHTEIQEISLPIVMAAVLATEGDYLGAVRTLETARPYERSHPAAIYIRGLAYLGAQDGAAAAAEFRRLQDLRGVKPTLPLHNLAVLGMARAYALSGVTEASREQYAEFFSRMEGADPGVPLLELARAEYAAL